MSKKDRIRIEGMMEFTYYPNYPHISTRDKETKPETIIKGRKSQEKKGNKTYNIGCFACGKVIPEKMIIRRGVCPFCYTVGTVVKTEVRE
jgi:hypothetical protein